MSKYKQYIGDSVYADFEGLWGMLRSSEEKRLDRKREAHDNDACDEACEFCDTITNMAKYFCKQEDEG